MGSYNKLENRADSVLRAAVASPFSFAITVVVIAAAVAAGFAICHYGV